MQPRMQKRIGNRARKIGLGEKLRSRRTGEITEGLILCEIEGGGDGGDGRGGEAQQPA